MGGLGQRSAQGPTWSAQRATRQHEHSFEPRTFEDTDDRAPDFYDAVRGQQPAGQRRQRRGRVVATVVSLLAIIAILVVIGQNMINNDAVNENDTDPVYNDTQDLNMTESVPSVINLRVAQSSSSSVTFAWDNPQPAQGDSYVWRIVDVDGSGTPTRTQAPLAQIPLVGGQESVCIEVSLVRENGKASTTPTRECSQ